MNSNVFVAPNMEQEGLREKAFSVRISTSSFGYQRELINHFEVPLLRVGRMVIYRVSPGPLKKPSEHLLMLRRTLIAALTFQISLENIFLLNTHIVRVLVCLMSCFLWIKFWRSSLADISRYLCKTVTKSAHPSLSYLFPNTLYIDTSLNSRDIIALFLLRYVTLWDELQRLSSPDGETLVT